MTYSLPYSVNIDGKKINIRNKCDFRVVLDVIEALNDEDLTEQEKIQCALYIFYGEELAKVSNYEEAVEQMLIIVNGGEEETEQTEKPRLMDWKHDFPILVAPINRVLNCEIRSVDYLHWWTLLSAYYEIGECTFQNVVSIRSKRMKGKKLEKWEEEFYRENRKMIDLPQKLTKEEQDFLDSDW